MQGNDNRYKIFHNFHKQPNNPKLNQPLVHNNPPIIDPLLPIPQLPVPETNPVAIDLHKEGNNPNR